MDAFRRDIVATMPMLKSRALKLTGNHTAAEDLLHDTIERALRKQEQFEMGTNLGGWLVTIMRNCFINDLRRNSRITFCDPQSETLARASEEPRQDNMILLDQVGAAVTSLPPERREAIRLAIEGTSMSEAAARQGVPEGTARSRLSRTRSAMRAWAEGAVA